MSSLELGELPQLTTAPSSVLELPAINQVQEDNQGNNEESSERQFWSSRVRSFIFGTQRSQSSKYQAHLIQPSILE